MPDNLEQLAVMISRRDGISLNEARNIVDDTREEIQELIVNKIRLGITTTSYEVYSIILNG